jgi:hypothetical protein
MPSPQVVLFFPFTGQDLRMAISPPHSLLAIASELVDDYEVLLIDQRVIKNWQKVLNQSLNQIYNKIF